MLSCFGFYLSKGLLSNILEKTRIIFGNLNPATINSKEFIQQLGTVRNEKHRAGVYIWTNIQTGAKYVGSSSSLARRLIGYFKGTHLKVGKFIPLLYEEGVEKFTLEVIPLNTEYQKYLELYIEQYFLLHSEFNLNTLKKVGAISGARSKVLFMYTKDFSKLIYSANAKEDFIFNLRIHHTLLAESIRSGKPYLGNYVFTETPMTQAIDSKMSVTEVLAMLKEDRLNKRKGRKIILTCIKNNKDIRSFNSISECIKFLSTVGPCNKTTLYRHVSSGKPYHGFICKLEEKPGGLMEGMKIMVTDVFTSKIVVYNSIRKAAFSFAPPTTGQTIKSYGQSGKIFRNKFLIKFDNL